MSPPTFDLSQLLVALTKTSYQIRFDLLFLILASSEFIKDGVLAYVI